MEKEGFVRGIHFFQNNDLTIKLLVTDKHKSIAKWVRENINMMCGMWQKVSAN